MRQFGLIQLADAFFDVLAEDKIQKRLKLAIVVGKYLVPVGINPLLARYGGQGKGNVASTSNRSLFSASIIRLISLSCSSP